MEHMYKRSDQEHRPSLKRSIIMGSTSNPFKQIVHPPNEQKYISTQQSSKEKKQIY